MADGGAPDEGSDPFENLSLDEEFVRGAEIHEDAAEARMERLRRIDEQHRRLQDQRATEWRKLEKRRRRGRWRTWVPVVGFFAVLAALGAWNLAERTSSSTTLGFGGVFANDGNGRLVQASAARPPAGVDEAATPLGQPAPLAAASSSYRYMHTQSDGTTPVAYDPCRPVHVVVNARTAVAGGDTLLRQSLDRVSAATGLKFVVDGPTDETPSPNRSAYLPDRYPGRWAPVLVAWTDPAQDPELAGDVAGMAGSAYVPTDRGSVYVSGGVALDGPQLAQLMAGRDGPDEVRGVIEHELGHLVGLDHVDDPTQLMNPVGQPGVTTYAAGDLTGLSRLGQGRCFPGV